MKIKINIKILGVLLIGCALGIMELDGEKVFLIKLEGTQGTMWIQMFENYGWLRFRDEFSRPPEPINPGLIELCLEVREIISRRAPQLTDYQLSFYDAKNHRPINIFNFNWLPIFNWFPFRSWFSSFKIQQLQQESSGLDGPTDILYTLTLNHT